MQLVLGLFTVLPMSDPVAQFRNFQEAFCAYHRCSPKVYARKALFMGIPFTRRLLAIPIYVFNRAFFAIDMGIIETRKSLPVDHPAVLSLASSYHNLLRRWADL